MPVVSYYNHQLQQHHRLSHPNLSSRSQRHPSLRLTQGCRAAPPPENIRFGACLLQEELRVGHGLLLGADIVGCRTCHVFVPARAEPRVSTSRAAAHAVREQESTRNVTHFQCTKRGHTAGHPAPAQPPAHHVSAAAAHDPPAACPARLSRMLGQRALEDPPGPWRWRRRARATDSERRRHARSNNGRKQLG